MCPAQAERDGVRRTPRATLDGALLIVWCLALIGLVPGAAAASGFAIVSSLIVMALAAFVLLLRIAIWNLTTSRA